MLEKLKLFFYRAATGPLINLLWLGNKATDLDIHDETIAVAGGRIRLRIYQPRGQGPHPVMLFFHGGGWVFGDLLSHDPVCRDLCFHGRHLVIAVDYRLAPEYPFPIPVEDCLASLQWARDNAARLGGDGKGITLCGDSAGGNLAAVCAQQARSLHPGLIKGQVLIYPVTDHCYYADWPSYKTSGTDDYGLSHKSMSQLWLWYLRGSKVWKEGDRKHDLATPLHVENLKGLPPMLMVLAEDDMLRDEGLEYARRAKEAGNEVQVKRYEKQLHGFIGLKPSEPYRQALNDIVAWLAR